MFKTAAASALAIAALSLAAAIACQPTQDPEDGALQTRDTSAEQDAAITSLIAGFMVAMNEGDIDALLDLYTDDVISMPPNQPALEGKGALLLFRQQGFEAARSQATIYVEEQHFSGDLAFVRGTYATTGTPRDGGPETQDNGKWMDLMRRQADGSWKIAREIWNSDNPPPET